MAFHNVPPNGFPDLPDVEELEAVVKDVTGLKADKAAKTDIAPAFSATSNYAVGDLVYHEGTLYVCSTAHAASAWDANDFTATSVAAELSGVVGDIGDLASTKANQITIASFFNPEASYEAGDLVYYNGLIYRCTNDHEGAWDAADFAATTIAAELDTLKSGLTNKTDYLYYDASSSASDDDALKDLFDDLDIYDKAVVGALNHSGYWMYHALKYSNGNYGSIVAFRFDGVAKFLSVYEGTKTIRSFEFGS